MTNRTEARNNADLSHEVEKAFANTVRSAQLPASVSQFQQMQHTMQMDLQKQMLKHLSTLKTEDIRTILSSIDVATQQDLGLSIRGIGAAAGSVREWWRITIEDD